MLLAKKGYRVFGTSRREQSAIPQNVEMLGLDVQSDQSVHACIEKLLALTNRIDLLINNAGQAHASVIEETSLEQSGYRQGLRAVRQKQDGVYAGAERRGCLSEL
jgi:NADP-dependent 3-hydroxy acid dehydrogenase YdfG